MNNNTPHPPSAPRKRLFTFIVLIFPVVFFVLLEIVLQVMNYGDDLSLFKSQYASGKTYLRMNPGVKGRYFFTTDFQPGASPDLFLRSKPENCIRLFCLGESTTAGYPFWYNAAFPAFLQTYLERVFPDKRIEVVNLGMTATNSFTVLDESREILQYQPDAIIVYDGHNEFYGALGVASRESLGRSRWFVELYLNLLRFKTFLLVRNVMGSLLTAIHPEETGVDRATMMEKLARGRMVPYGSSLYEAGVRTFGKNLQDLSAECRDAHVPLILCTQVSNLALPPFASIHSDRLSPDLCRSVEEETDAGGTLLHPRQFNDAIGLLHDAVAVDSDFAMTHYFLAVALDSLHRTTEAHKEYIEARDKDPVRFRACSDLNRAIRSCENGASCADVEKSFAEAGRGTIGFDLITEHLHPTVYGQFLIARTIVNAMKSNGILLTKEEWARRDTVADSVVWDQRTVTPLDERIGKRKTEILTAGWPFVQGQKVLDDIAATDTLGLIAEGVTRGRLDWRAAHEAAAAYYAHRGDLTAAAAEMRAIALTFKLDPESYKRWARLALRAGRTGEARYALERTSSFCPDPEAEKMLGDLLLAKGDFQNADARYRSALSLAPPSILEGQTRYARSLALLKLGRIADSQTELEHVLRIDPGNASAKALLERLGRPQVGHP
ncbi:MAG: hypothetical protein WB699_01660 [Bacteroidota bacterium]